MGSRGEQVLVRECTCTLYLPRNSDYKLVVLCRTALHQHQGDSFMAHGSLLDYSGDNGRTLAFLCVPSIETDGPKKTLDWGAE